MNQIKDLNIEVEILPIFDYSLNKYTKNKILELLKNPLSSIPEIEYRQKIIKGISKNYSVLNDYSYTLIYFNQVYSFLNNFDSKTFETSRLKYGLLNSKAQKAQNRNNFSLLITFFHRLNSKYFSRLTLSDFPLNYIEEIKKILAFFGKLNLTKYEEIIREKGLSNKHIFEIAEIINDLKNENLIKGFWANFFLFETYISLSKSIRRNNFVFPTFTSDYEIKIEGFYHPILENPVPNDLNNSKNILVINGPNMSGKSTFLKSISICIYLSHLGIAIPAKNATIPFFQSFYIKINKKDDILNGYSHFMNEIISVKNVVLSAKQKGKVFAVFDELFSATNVEDAFEISRITINGLRRFKDSLFLISTHIQRLKDVSNEEIINYHLSSEIKDEKPVFTYKLKKGWSDLRVGKILFELEGLTKLLE